MLSELLAKSSNRFDCANNYLSPRISEIISLLKQIESIAGTDYQIVFENRKKLGKGSFLLKEGRKSTRFWFIEEGIARQYFIKNEKEITNDFFFPCEFVDAYGTSSLGLPAEVNIQLLTDAWVRIIDYNELSNLEKKFPALWQVERLIAASNIYWLEKRLYSIQHLSASERYSILLKQQPYLIKEIPLSYIASFLNVSLATLSRIRAKLKYII
jgi:CRP-like cAMP-binding protein